MVKVIFGTPDISYSQVARMRRAFGPIIHCHRRSYNERFLPAAQRGPDGARQRAGAGPDQAAVRPAHQESDRGAGPAAAARQRQQDQDRQVQIPAGVRRPAAGEPADRYIVVHSKEYEDILEEDTKE